MTTKQPKAWKFEAIKLFKEGKGLQVIADKLGKNYFTVATHIHRHKDSGKFDEPVLIPEPIERSAYMSPVCASPYGESPLAQVKADYDYLVHSVGCEVKRQPTIFVIGDTQVKQGCDLAYIHYLGAYIARKKPDIIAHLGDHFDMASLSSYDVGKLSAEGKRFAEDIKAGNDALFIIESYIKAVPNYNPRKVVTLGNHEDRITRFVADNPALDGFLGSHLFDFEKYGWEVYPFLTPVVIEGIMFVHYVVNQNTGKPLGQAMPTRLKEVGRSFVMGHQQTFAYHERGLVTGEMQMGLVVGACYDHDEAYKGVQGNHHFRGCVMLYEVQDGYAMHKKITLRHMKNVFEGNV